MDKFAFKMVVISVMPFYMGVQQLSVVSLFLVFLNMDV